MRAPVALVAAAVAVTGAIAGLVVVTTSKTHEAPEFRVSDAEVNEVASYVLGSSDTRPSAVVPAPAEPVAPAPADVVKPAEPVRPIYAIEAIRELQGVREKSSVDFLVTAAEILEAGLDSVQTTEALTAVHETLTSLTAKEFKNAAAWRAWWTANRETFALPKALDRGETPDIPDELGVFEDAVFGWSTREPAAAGWSFAKPEFAGPRVALMFDIPSEDAGGKPYPVARAHFSVLVGKKYPSLERPDAFLEWAKKDVFATQLDTHERPLDVSEKTFGGATWIVLKGKGDGVQSKRGWGAMERRFYVTEIGAGLLYVDAFVRLGAEDDVKKALWDAVEATVVGAKK